MICNIIKLKRFFYFYMWHTFMIEDVKQKKFSGRKMKAGEVYIHISSTYDEFRELYNKDDSVLAQYLNNHINNELQTKILSYLNEEHIKPFVENNSYNEINTTFDDDFIIDEYERIEENIITNETD